MLLVASSSPRTPANPFAVGTTNRAGCTKAKQLEHIQPRQFGITQPLRHQWRIEHDQRRLRCPAHSLALANAAHLPVGRGQPDTGMAGMERGEGEVGRRAGHAFSHNGDWNVRETVWAC